MTYEREIGIRGQKILTQRVGFLTDIHTKEKLTELAARQQKTVNALLNEIVTDYLVHNSYEDGNLDLEALSNLFRAGNKNYINQYRKEKQNGKNSF